MSRKLALWSTASPASTPTGETTPDYCLAVGFLQPHWQLFIWQRHAFFWHAQEQASQSQVSQQLDLLTVFEVVFVKSDIFVSLIYFVFLAPHALSWGLTYICPKPYSAVHGVVVWPGE